MTSTPPKSLQVERTVTHFLELHLAQPRGHAARVLSVHPAAEVPPQKAQSTVVVQQPVFVSEAPSSHMRVFVHSFGLQTEVGDDVGTGPQSPSFAPVRRVHFENAPGAFFLFQTHLPAAWQLDLNFH